MIDLTKPVRGQDSGKAYFTSFRFPLELAKACDVRAQAADISFAEFVRQAAERLCKKIKAKPGIKSKMKESKGTTSEYNARYRKSSKKKGKKSRH